MRVKLAVSTEDRRAKGPRILDHQPVFSLATCHLSRQGPLKNGKQPGTATAAACSSSSRRPQFFFGSGAARNRCEDFPVGYAEAQAYVHTIEYVFQQAAVKNVAGMFFLIDLREEAPGRHAPRRSGRRRGAY